MIHEILNGFKKSFEFLGFISLLFVPAMISADLINWLIKKVYPKFNPKTAWKSGGSTMQALPANIVAGATAFCVSSELRDYQFPNLWLPLLCVIMLSIYFYRKRSYFYSDDFLYWS